MTFTGITAKNSKVVRCHRTAHTYRLIVDCNDRLIKAELVFGGWRAGRDAWIKAWKPDDSGTLRNLKAASREPVVDAQILDVGKIPQAARTRKGKTGALAIAGGLALLGLAFLLMY